jgi:hypothetical protein
LLECYLFSRAVSNRSGVQELFIFRVF